MSSSKGVTELLIDWSNGKQEAMESLMPLVYDELRRLARAYMRRESPGNTLQPTALVNEAYLRLIDQREVRWQNRAHFFGIAAQLMRRILVDRARRHHAAKRGGAGQRVSLEEVNAAVSDNEVDLISLDDALEKLAALDPQQSRVVELKFFGGLTIEEIAEVLGISPATIKREWSLAKAWLHREVSGSP